MRGHHSHVSPLLLAAAVAALTDDLTIRVDASLGSLPPTPQRLHTCTPNDTLGSAIQRLANLDVAQVPLSSCLPPSCPFALFTLSPSSPSRPLHSLRFCGVYMQLVCVDASGAVMAVVGCSDVLIAFLEPAALSPVAVQ